MKKKAPKKIHKKGTIVILYSTCTYSHQCGAEGAHVTLEQDYTEEELDKMAWENALEEIQVEGWFEVKEEE